MAKHGDNKFQQVTQTIRSSRKGMAAEPPDADMPEAPPSAGGQPDQIKRSFEELSEEEAKLLFNSRGDFAQFQGQLREMAKKQKCS